jgi:hypothetical protein
MSHYRLRAILVSVLVSVILPIIAGCDDRPRRLSPTKVDAMAAALEAMAMYDTNKDGRIADEELDRCPSLKAIAIDNAVTRHMIAARILGWQSAGFGRAAVGIAVFHNGKGLADASVRLVPEKFLSDITPATGRTDANGATIITVPTSGPEEPKGASAGFYRVEITKNGEDIPAKYNTETTLGMAVFRMENIETFDLVY